ncbi:hypothetical protein HYPBUDRAFT_141631 [Hyphopichia burtonii NRRL Y-1933]|uniref:UNC-45/Cro1/She4 central domain-containing protein n=1 Tax=Hyphopichia burtonii NRRL Y-1933 TaxID=984485 RepID=A0A1E4RFB2_9ASCO|nr:hypothetical protein HYPBUDRAFT_141631 [Hyphopichia burtonii NRRL Y-1933]ODV65815.1 hypothetical protein HYPBUDRAFT_141631 [Hyphopichia burtonii NRRL Y-1933]
MSESIAEQLDRLHISDSQVDEALRVFNINHSKELITPNVVETLVKCSDNHISAKILFDLLEEDNAAFLYGIGLLDKDGIKVLSNVLHYYVRDNNRLGFEMLKVNLRFLKESLNDESTLCYLKIYFNLITKLELVNPHHLSILLGLINVKNDEINSLILLIVINFLQKNESESNEQIKDYLEILVDEDIHLNIANKKYLNLVKVLECLFPITPIINQIYTTEKMKKIILEKIRVENRNEMIIVETLRLVCSSCIDDKCRSFNVEHYLDLLSFAIENSLNDKIKYLSVLATIKLWNFIQLDKKKVCSIEDLYSRLVEYFNKTDNLDKDELLTYIIESLAYLTINHKVKKSLRSEQSIIEQLIGVLPTLNESQIVYGILVIFVNLSQFKDNNKSQDHKTIDYLKNYSQPSGEKQQFKEDPAEINSFNESLNEQNIISVISSLKVKNSNIMSQFINIIYNILFNQSKQVKVKMVEQGAINILIDYMIQHSKIKNGETSPIKENEIRLNSIRSLSRILISINPKLGFKKYDIKTCIPFLIELLGPNINKNFNEEYLYDITSLDKFETLMALTNISAINDQELKKYIINKTFDQYLDNFIIDNNEDLQRCSWELIANLIDEPIMLAKFFNFDKKEVLKRCLIMIKLLNSTNNRLQIAISNLLVNSTQDYQFICYQIMNKLEIINELIKVINQVIQNQFNDDELMIRLSYLLNNLITISYNQEYLKIFQTNNQLITNIAKLIHKNDEFKQISIDSLKMITEKS